MSGFVGFYSFREQNKVERVSPVDPDISSGVTDLYPSRGYTHPVTRAIEVSHTRSLPSRVLIQNPSWPIQQLNEMNKYLFIYFSTNNTCWEGGAWRDSAGHHRLLSFWAFQRPPQAIVTPP